VHIALETENVVLFHADCRDALRTLADDSIDSIVTDPPYELGFMGKSWDNAGIAFDKGLWAEALRVLKPGGHLVAFGGTRTYHRMACAIEDAGFEVRDSLHWMYGSGFPKSLNLDGAHEGWGTALKPAHEPIILARKPLVGTVAANVEAHGTGALNIDGCRIATTDNLNGGTYSGGKRNPVPGDERSSASAGRYGEDGRLNPEDFVQPEGRWPPNILLSHTPECVEGGTCAEDCAVAELDRQSGVRKSGNVTKDYSATLETSVALSKKRRALNPDSVYADEGGASRFFPVFRYEAKAARSERERGCDGLPARTGAEAVDREEGSAGTQSPRAGAGRTAKQVRNHHPTVKPIALMRWLCRLVTPPGGVVLDPFTGSGTTGIAAVQEGFSFVGIEKDTEHGYIEIAKARIGHALTNQAA
jgi:DNA modification methylase